MIAGALRLVSGVEKAAGFAAAVALAAIMLIATGDVAMRYVLNKPFPWSYDLISLYLMVALFYLVVSGAYAHHAHVSVDILHAWMSPRQRRLCEIVVNGLSAALFAMIAWVGLRRAATAFVDGDVIAGAIEWPSWLSVAFVPFGAGLLTLRLTLHFIGHVLSLFLDKPLIELPPVSGSPEAMDREMAE